MLPSAAQFSAQMKALGAPKDANFVVYDNHGFMPGPRVMYMIHAFGVNKLRLLNGGLHNWTLKNYPVETGPQGELPPAPEGDYNYTLDKNMIYDFDQVEALQTEIGGGAGDKAIVDARGPDMFSKGNIPNSTNVPVGLFFDETTHEVKSPAALNEIFESKGIKKEQFVVFSCQRAITACSAAMAHSMRGGHKLAVYDGAFSEYGKKKA